MAAIEYKDLEHEAAEIDSAIDLIVNHVANTGNHVTQAEKDSWNAKASSSDVAAEAQARQTADESLQAAIDGKADAGDLTSEAAAREQADTSEAAARAAADAKHESVLAGMIDGGAKNLLEMTSTVTTVTRSGVTATYDKAAGTVTLTGAHVDGTTAAIFEFYSGNAVDQKVIPAGTYRLCGCPSGGSTSTFRGALTQIAGGVDVGNGATFTLTEPHYIAYRILISGDCDFSGGVVFQPMICLQAAWEISDKIVPYCPPPAELYAMILALQS